MSKINLTLIAFVLSITANAKGIEFPLIDVPPSDLQSTADVPNGISKKPVQPPRDCGVGVCYSDYNCEGAYWGEGEATPCSYNGGRSFCSWHVCQNI